MGAWGPGLYSSDFARDLRSTLAVVLRLPYDAPRLLEIVCQTAGRIAEDANDVDHSTFWLVTADQFHKYGIALDPLSEKAITIIDRGTDIAMMRDRGMAAKDLRKRAGNLAGLRQRLRIAPTAKRRRTLNAPEPFIMDVGDVLTYPLSGGQPINPYSADRHFFGWTQDAWGAMLVVSRGRAFGFLSWYSILTVQQEIVNTPSMLALLDVRWICRSAGPCSPLHFKRMELERMSRVRIDQEALVREFGRPPDGFTNAILDVSIANAMSAASANPKQPVVQKNLERARSALLRDLLTSAGGP